MKTTRIKSLFILLSMLCFANVQAQDINELSVKDVSGMRGKIVSVPVYLTNTAEVTALQFDIELPNGSTVYFDSTTVAANRSVDHIISGQNKNSNRRRFMLYSPTKQPLKGNMGKICDVVFKVSTYLEDEQVYDIKLSNVIISDLQGNNVFTNSVDATLSLISYPDFEVSNLAVTSANITPGGQLSLSWNVKNIGQTAATGGWKENFYLVGDNGTEVFVGSNSFESTGLAVNAAVNRTATVTLPDVLGVDGTVKAKVSIKGNADSGERSESEWNNSAVAETGITLTKTLQMVMPSAPVREQYGRNVRLQLYRSGNRTAEETFTLTADKPSRVELPSTVTISRNQSGAAFYVNIIDDAIYNDADTVILITASGNGYQTATGRLVIEDNEYPDLQLEASRSELNEGETFLLTVTLPKPARADLEVKFTAETPKRFNLPASVVIPTGSTSATVEVEAVQNSLPELQLATAFYATATNYNKAEAIVILNDDDMPELELVLSPTQVSESSGPASIMAKLYRRSHTDSEITIVMSDDSDGDIYYSQRRFTMKSGVTTAEFAIGTIDNAQKEGDRTVNVSAGVYVSSCNCAASGTTVGVSTVAVTILDDDGPTLSLSSSSSSLLEGKTNATTLTVKRNTGTSGALTVSITSDQDDGLTYTHTATIPNGQSSVTVPVSVKKNDVANDERTVVFTVTANGYTQGTCWALITDQTMPDAIVEAPMVDAEGIPAAGTVEITVSVSNVGNADLPAQTCVNLYMLPAAGSKSLLTTLYTQQPIGSGQKADLTKQVTMPDVAGNYRLQCIINEDKAVRELVYLNNTSAETPLRLVPPFTAEVSVEKATYQNDEPVLITGTATGSNVVNKAVEVYLLHSNVRDTLCTTTDAMGRFSVTFDPKGVAGHYAIGACYPGENLRDEQDAFDIYGMRRTDGGYLKYEPTVGVPYSASISITNSGDLPLHNIDMEVLSSGGNIEVAVDRIATLNGGKSSSLPITLTATEASQGDEWQLLKVRFTSDEGAAFDGLIYYYNRTATGKLRASVNAINTTMIKGKQRDYSFDITNTGYGSTGKISLALPEGTWMSAVTGKEMGALSSTDTATIVLRLTPSADMQLNVPIRGTIGINCANGQGMSLPFTIEPVSDDMGELVVDVCDEYTYYTEEAPHLANATVKVTHPTTGRTVAEGVTGEDGRFTAPLPEGWYTVSVSADKHDSYRGNVLVDPGRQTVKVINLSYQAVTINWEVKETEVEDKYEIVTTATFETHVPAPVVIIRGPNKIDADAMLVGESQMLYYTVTNEGLINAKNCTFVAPQSDSELLFEALANTGPFDLAANQSVLIPVKVTKTGGGASGSKSFKERSGNYQLSTINSQLSTVSDNAFTHCMKNLGVLYEILCGKDLKSNSAMLTLAVRFCAAGVAASGFGGGSGGGPGSPGKAGGSYGYGGSAGYTYLESDDPCDPELANTKKTIMDGFTSMAPGMGGCLGFGLNAERMAQAAASGDDAEMAGSVCDFGASTATTFSPPVAQPFIGFVSIFAGLYGSSESKPFKEDIRIADEKKDLLRKYSWLAAGVDIIRWYYRQLECYRKVYLNYYGDEAWFTGDDDTRPDFFRKLCSYDNYEDITYDNLLAYKPASITDQQLASFIERLRNTIFHNESDNKMDIQYMLNEIALAKYINRFEAPSSQPNHSQSPSPTFKGQSVYPQDDLGDNYYGDDINPAGEMFVAAVDQLKADFNDASKTQSVCVTIKLQFKQELVLTRQAFRGTLTVNNGNEETPMENVKLMLKVTDEDGNVATAHEFQINTESLDGFEGDLDGEWALDPKKTGTATILFIPTKYAAPEYDRLYSFGGSLSYTDPNTGLVVTRDLQPVTLTVKPSPQLDLTYFMQRDILGDDPLTKDVVEPMVPAEFALLINNVGYGDATNVRMTTHQPEIVDNEKGLLIDFELLSSQVNGGDKTLALGSSVPADFGTIPAQGTSYAQWWFTSTLLGHFLDYQVEATHVTSYGNEDLSLLNSVTIHELIRSINARDAAGMPLKGWLVNDITDNEDLPDMLYLSNGDIEQVGMVRSASIARNDMTHCTVTIQPADREWNYGNVNDPTLGRQNIISVVRDDGVELDLRNVWQTDRTLRDGMDPINECRIHFFDKLVVDGQPHTYTITFEPRPDVVLKVVEVTGLPKNNELTREAITTMTVKLNKPVRSFTADNLRLQCQGNDLLEQPTIQKIDDLTYQLTYNSLAGASGYLVLTVYVSKMVDNEGYTGDYDFHTTWIQFIDGKCTINMAASPVYGGTVQPGSSEQIYDTDVTLTATPAQGYAFSHWLEGDEIISDSAEFDYHITALSSLSTLTAVFTPQLYDVSLIYDETGGIVRGLGSGRYEYGITVHLQATPVRNYDFDYWMVNGVKVGTDEKLDLLIDGTKQVEAVFKYSPTKLIVAYNLAEGWNWVSVDPTDEALLDTKRLMAHLGGRALEIRGKDKSLVYENGQWKGDLITLNPGEAYQILVSEATLMNIETRIPEANIITIKRGWNHVAYDSAEELPITTALTNWHPWPDDMVKGQDGFAIYDGSQWVGTLQTMQPGKGYQIYAQTVGSFSWPTTPVEHTTTVVADYQDEEDSGLSPMYYGQSYVTALPDRFTSVDRRRFADNMCIVADLEYNGSVVNSENYMVGAFVDGETRGMGTLVGGHYFISVYGQPDENVEYHVFNKAQSAFLFTEGASPFRHIAYCNLDQPTMIELFDDDPNAISSKETTAGSQSVYDLQGRKINPQSSTDKGQLPKGIYIVNGRLVKF